MHDNDQRANQRRFYNFSSTQYRLNDVWCGEEVHLCGRSCNFNIVRLGGSGQFLLLRCDVGFVAIHVVTADIVGMIAER